MFCIMVSTNSSFSLFQMLPETAKLDHFWLGRFGERMKASKFLDKAHAGGGYLP